MTTKLAVTNNSNNSFEAIETKLTDDYMRCVNECIFAMRYKAFFSARSYLGNVKSENENYFYSKSTINLLMHRYVVFASLARRRKIKEKHAARYTYTMHTPTDIKNATKNVCIEELH